MASLQAAGRVPNHEASAAKLFVTELSQRIAQLGQRLLGLYGPVRRGSKWAPLKGRVARMANAAEADREAVGCSAWLDRFAIARTRKHRNDPA